jgi:hypothetical protein
MSPLVKIKCPQYGRQSEFESEAVEEMASSRNGIGEAFFIERGSDRIQVSYRYAKRLKVALALDNARLLAEIEGVPGPNSTGDSLPPSSRPVRFGSFNIPTFSP